jgi:hypothetical protein
MTLDFYNGNMMSFAGVGGYPSFPWVKKIETQEYREQNLTKSRQSLHDTSCNPMIKTLIKQISDLYFFFQT